MEQNNNNNEFEHFLKESIADFIMIPQRKVWYGIYNHLHPEKKWPSIAVCFCILVSIMHIGISNNKNINTGLQQAKNNMHYKQNNSAVQIIKDNAVSLLPNIAQNQIPKNKIENNSNPNYSQVINTSSFVKNDITNTVISYAKSQTKTKINIGIQYAIATEDMISNIAEDAITNEEISSEKNIAAIKNNNTKDLETFNAKNNIEINNKLANKKPDAATENNLTGYINTVKLPKVKKKKEIVYYITPSIGYRVMEQNDGQKFNDHASYTAAITTNYGTAYENLEDKKALNYEIGAVINKKINEKIKLQAGVQVNYTNYISKATSLSHPTQSLIAQRNTNASYKNMDYASAAGNINLNKTTLQIAVPIGITHKILGNEKINWNVGATIQPALVIGGSGYVLSADKKYYVTEKDLLNRFNVNIGAETFISIKTANGIYLNVGPQFRYQLTSTYKKTYNYSENLYNLGLKIGVATTL